MKSANNDFFETRYIALIQLKIDRRAARIEAIKTILETIFHPRKWEKKNKPILFEMVWGKEAEKAVKNYRPG